MKFMDILLEAEGDKKPKPTTIEPGTEDADSTDYSAEEPEEDPEEGDPEEGDGEDDEEEENTDYTEEEETSTSDETEAEDEAPAEEEEDGGSEPTGEDNPQDTAEQENNRKLLTDFIELHHLVKSTAVKLNSIDKSNILINKVVTQITTNLNALQKQLFDFLRFSFRKGKYVTNLYTYNYFLEAFKVNVGMLKKISIFVPNYQNN